MAENNPLALEGERVRERVNTGGEVKLIKSNLNHLAKNLRTNQTDAEKLLWKHLRSKQLADTKFRRQQPIGNYIVDFVSLDHKLIIELDGGQHAGD